MLDAKTENCQDDHDTTSMLLDDVAGFLRRYVVLEGEAIDALALWVAHTHAFEAAEMTPYIVITSAVKECGKSTLLMSLELLVAKPERTDHVSRALIPRLVQEERPTLLLDEADTVFGNGKSRHSEGLRNILNSGYRLGGSYSTLEQGQSGGYGRRKFSTFCPKAIAAIGELPDTVLSRSIVIEMRRKLRREHVEPFKDRLVRPPAAQIKDRLEHWASRSTEPLVGITPEMPPELGDRASDIWEPLVAIADLAGEPWTHRSRAAAVTLSARARARDESHDELLLRDVHRVLLRPFMPSEDLLMALTKLEESPWGRYDPEWGPTLTVHTLAKLLKPYGIAPAPSRINGQQRRGYHRTAFEDAWSRYLPSEDLHTVNNRHDSDTSVELVELVETEARGTGGNA